MGINVSSHSGHRERVRYVVEHNGLRYLPPYQVLEFLLFYGIPYKDTKPIAYELLSKFGTLKNVFLADVKELMQVKNMTKNAALLLKSYGEIYDSVFKAELSDKTVLGPNNVLSYLRDLFSDDLTEKLVVISLNEKNELISCDTLAYGTPDSIAIPAKDLVAIVLRNNAKKVILAHNHPSKLVTPSVADTDGTDMAGTLLHSIGVKLIDHVIISRDYAYSYFLRCRLSTGEQSVYPMYKHDKDKKYPF